MGTDNSSIVDNDPVLNSPNQPNLEQSDTQNTQNHNGHSGNVTLFKTPDHKNSIPNSNPNSITIPASNLKRSATVSSGSRSKSPLRRHLKSLSITSSNSNSANNSVKKSLNLGFNVIDPNNSKFKDNNLNSNHEFITPKRLQFKNNNVLSPSLPQSLNNDNNNNSHNNSHNNSTIEENLNFDGPRSSIETVNTDISLVMESSPTPKNIFTDDGLSESFRLLASKEMEILEIKNKLKELLEKKKDKELELRVLKQNIETQLKKNIQLQQHQSHNQNIPKSPLKQKIKIKSTTSNIDPLLDDSFNSSYNKSDYDKRQSWFSKPLNLIQQFDNMIYKEFENDFLNTNLDDEKREINTPIKSLANESSNDVIQSVSNNFWSFVNDFKSNLLVEENDNDNDNDYDNGNGPGIGIGNGNDKSKQKNHNQIDNNSNLTHMKTASFSKRQSYSKHNTGNTSNTSNNTTRKSSSSFSNNSRNLINDNNNDNDNYKKSKNKNKILSNPENNLNITKENLNEVVENLSKIKGSNSSSKIDLNKNTEMNSALMDLDFNETDLWDNETLDI